jgi:tetratricopeptide (TPR) repeat protein
MEATQLAASDPGRAYGLLEEAAELASWEPRYVFEQANLLDATGQQEAALDAYESAATVNKQWWDAHIASARLSAFLGDLDRSALWYEEVLRIDPVAPDMKFEAGRVAFLRSDANRAVELLEAAVTDKSDVADWWLLLAEARFAAGDEAGGQLAYEKAIEINPALADPP